MPRFFMEANVNCGVTYAVDADNIEQARQIMGTAIVEHINEGCDGVEIVEVPDDAHDIDLVVSMPNHDEPHKLEYHERT